MPAPLIDLTHEGTPAADWRPRVDSMPTWRADPTRHRRIVVVAPHPDDETLGCGGIIAEAAAMGLEVVVVSLTDGEASSDEPGLGDRRHRELIAALDELAPARNSTIVRCGLPDGQLTANADRIAAILEQTVVAGDLVFAPLDCDGHPDHDAAGAAVRPFIDRADVEVLHYPIWAWHWHDPSESVVASAGRRVEISPAAAAAKARALRCFTSQLTGAQPVLPSHFVDRFDTPMEVVVPTT